MSITGAGSITAANVLAQTDMMNQLNTLGLQLSTGQVATNYSDLASQAGLALSLNAQLSAINGYNTAASNVGTTLSIAQSALTQLGDAQTSVQAAVSDQSAFSLDSTGQTATQESAAGYLDQILAALNTQVGNNYIFSGSATDQPSVAPTNEILNGNGAQAGLTTVIQQRQQADLGSGLGRLTIGASGTTVTVGQDGSPFGFQLASVNSSLTGATVTGPTGSPPSISVALGATNPNAGDNIQFSLTLPDGTTQDVTLHGHHQFAAGREPVHDRRDAVGHRDQSADRAHDRRRQSGADGAACGVRHRSRQ